MNVFSNKLNSIVLLISIFLLLTRLVSQVCLAQVYIKPQFRCKNYDSYLNNGSCVHASTITALRHINQHTIANWIPIHYSGGEFHYDLNRRLNKWGIATKATFSSSKEILDYAHSHRLTAVISYHDNHSCLFLGWYVDPKTRTITHAYVLNPNYTSHIETPLYEDFMNNWRRNGGEAIVPLPFSTKNRRK